MTGPHVSATGIERMQIRRWLVALLPLRTIAQRPTESQDRHTLLDPIHVDRRLRQPCRNNQGNIKELSTGPCR